MHNHNLFHYKIPKQNETFSTLFEHKNIKIMRIISSDIFESKLYKQEEDEWVIVIEGAAVIKIDDEEKKVKKGDSLFIPSNTPHQILKMTKGTLWLAIHIF